ncbi:universal stress protein [Natrialbaceae archaeon A-CW2]|uniref:universal stress protein n=1 Tax=Natronosalvus amylolyticus TaxID=2961994 RepID=UPI0020C9651E|nr:universal stress protein [Natronosalvus amylolyticus]
MTLVVPFDGSPLAKAALIRAADFERVLNDSLVVLSVIPRENTGYARDRGWLEPGEAFDLDRITEGLAEDIETLAPSATFRYRVVDRYATAGTIAIKLRQMAQEVDASMVFVGSENAGRIVTSLSSIGTNVAADNAYDVVIVRNRKPEKIERRKERHSRE